MDKQAKKLPSVPEATPKKPTKVTTIENPKKKKTTLGKRKKSEPEGNPGAVVMREARKKIQKLTHSNTAHGESDEKMKSEMMLNSFVQPELTCACGNDHTITLSGDGTLYSFGYNRLGQLGLGHNNDVSLPTPIQNLPKINMISCGGYFTVCVDDEGFIWSFGDNNCGQLGTGNKTNFNVPQKLQDIPPVVSVSCGGFHTLMITNEDNLWSCGKNEQGQLCHGDKEYRSKPQKTSFSNISKISTGYSHSLFLNNKGEIFACGNNNFGQCGLGHFNHPQITPSLIPNLPPNIVHFVCGGSQCLFLDSEGNVFSVGNNYYGELGLGHNINQNVLNKIPNIPPIKIISCVGSSCYLIDFEGNLWTFGDNDDGQLGHGDKKKRPFLRAPTKLESLDDIQQISYGSSDGQHFFAKNSQNQIFFAGNNSYGQLGTGDTQSLSIPKQINSQYSSIWRDERYSRAKSARK